MMSSNSSDIKKLYSDQVYFNLPIASLTSNETETTSAVDAQFEQIVEKYSDKIYRKIAEYDKQISETTSKNINNIALVSAHGLLNEKRLFVKVPNDIIIAFITPINKYSYKKQQDLLNIGTTLEKIQNNPNLIERNDFMNNLVPQMFSILQLAGRSGETIDSIKAKLAQNSTK